MSKVTTRQRQERMQSPYTISRPVKTEFNTTVIQLIGVYYEQVFNGEEFVVTRQEFDLGQHSNLTLASKEAEEYRNDPEEYYAKFQRDRAVQVKDTVLSNPDGS